MLIAVVATVAALGFALGLALPLYQRTRRRARVLADPDGPRTLMPGFDA
ncbi:MAG: hypothetical protein Q8O79_01460 [Pseudomonadota bacterium]|nr:hypothetical protein [Pseudomonadota bacterium]